MKSSWFNGSCNVTTYELEELLGTKLRALYQRSKGRDLYDIHIAISRKPFLRVFALLNSYKEYMRYSTAKSPTQKQFILNMDEKMKDPEFLGDTTALLRPDVLYDPYQAYEIVRSQLIEKI